MKKLLIINSLLLFSFIVIAQEDSITNDYDDYQNIEVERTREAHYADGDQALYIYFHKNIKYSKEAVANKLQGEVMVSFMVGLDSTITEIKILKDPGYGCGEEIRRILKILKYVPAKEMGIVIGTNVILNVPVKAR